MLVSVSYYMSFDTCYTCSTQKKNQILKKRLDDRQINMLIVLLDGYYHCDIALSGDVNL